MRGFHCGPPHLWQPPEGGEGSSYILAACESRYSACRMSVHRTRKVVHKVCNRKDITGVDKDRVHDLGI